jgi:hypothetical protein
MKKTAPHGRAHEHMKRLLKTAFAGAALGTVSCGSLVCDPLPTPICDRNPTTSQFLSQGLVATSAVWKKNAAGTLGVAAELTINNFGQDKLVFNTDPETLDAAVNDIVRTDGKLTFTLAPNAGVTEVQVVIKIDCSTVAEALKLGFNVGTPVDGQQVTVVSLE